MTVSMAMTNFRRVSWVRGQWREPKLIANGPLKDFFTASVVHPQHGATIYGVIDSDSLCPIGIGETKAGALAWARDAVSKDSFLEYLAELRRLSDARRTCHEIDYGEGANVVHTNPEHLEEARQSAARDVKARPIPKRRLEIFDKSEGKCHYCATPLTLDGRWHIEHMQPRALLGPNDKSNLVAACVPCNMKKRDRTAEEFIAQGRGVRA